MKKEFNLLALTQELWNKFLEQGFTHPDESYTIREHIHSIQSIIATRMMKKLAPNIFPTYKTDENGEIKVHQFTPEEHLEAIKSILPEDLREKICK